MSSFLSQINWNSDGLVPVITQEASTLRVLTLAWLNREALQTAVAEGRAVYWSRSRGELWRKGDESGNNQELVDVFLDCDNDTVCYLVNQVGGIACHTGRESCFYQKLIDDQWQILDPVLKDPEEMYKR
ncbi:MAG: phosphoribosyl-AMP cyclohydrolase [Gammaproteobacteria bacterium]|jgi:phosphoribosyl-AMP cyclohydrolase|nr:phosphoribosyl-AMP cyclohydrolase [Gammaproteobacteria bacterium]MDP6096833.1 phosphoribosyl-AMP cyclohydrolase [Gammaproteobacteria bacterium]|tara:strand:+ start:623 stop:1009 length:387 start_codon:yes stop_codon:yes gene_type:complete